MSQTPLSELMMPLPACKVRFQQRPTLSANFRCCTVAALMTSELVRKTGYKKLSTLPPGAATNEMGTQWQRGSQLTFLRAWAAACVQRLVSADISVRWLVCVCLAPEASPLLLPHCCDLRPQARRRLWLCSVKVEHLIVVGLKLHVRHACCVCRRPIN